MAETTNPDGRIRLKDIAAEANVSVSTVSLVLNHKPGVAQSRRRRILELLEQHGYPTDGSHIKRGRTEGTISFVVYDRDEIQTSHNPFFDAVLRGVEPAAQNDHYNLSVIYLRRHGETSVHTLEGIDALKRAKPDGVLLDASVSDRPLDETFPDLGVPLVLIDNIFRDDPVDAVAIDNRGGTFAAVNHLVDAGHTDIGLVCTSIPTPNFNERRAAFSDALRARGLTPADECTFLLRPSQDGAYEDMQRILAGSPRLPSALFAANDILAFGTIRALKEQGVRVPDNLSIVGFDDLPFAEMIEPRLTTVHVYTERIASIAVHRLIERLRGHAPEFIKVRVGTELVVRDSVHRQT